MVITSYRLELDNDRHPELIKEKSDLYPGNSMHDPRSVTDMLNCIFHAGAQAEEHLYMVAVDTAGHPLGVFDTSHGSASTSVANPREVFIRALLCGASGIILAHNHPSGNVCPSSDDMEAYKRFDESGRMLGIKLLDSIIIGDGYYSFMEHEENR